MNLNWGYSFFKQFDRWTQKNDRPKKKPKNVIHEEVKAFANNMTKKKELLPTRLRIYRAPKREKMKKKMIMLFCGKTAIMKFKLMTSAY